MKNLLTLLTCSCLAVTGANAAIYSLYTDLSSEAGFDASLVRDGTTTIVSTVVGSGAFGTGDALRVADLSTSDKPEASWSSANFGGSDLTGAFRLDIDALALDIPGGSQDINFRFSNSGSSLSSQSNQLNTISFEQSGIVKVDGSTVDDNAGDATSYSFFINVDPVNSFTYTFGDQIAATLAADTTVSFVDGILTHTKMNPAGGTGFDNALGVNQLGFIGSSDSASGMDWLFDNISLSTGEDAGFAVIPEPSAISLLLGAIALGFVARRRR